MKNFSLLDSLRSGVGGKTISLSGPADVEHKVGLAGTLHRLIEGSNKI